MKNVAASVRQRLLNRARNDKRPFNELLQYYAMERFLYRLSRSDHAARFILKGALMLRVWRAPEFRPTMDIDMLGRTSNETSHIVTQIRDVLAVPSQDDGIIFDSDSIETESIDADADYSGLRVRFRAGLDTARITIQIDIGFGDVIYPEPEEAELPTMLDDPAPRLLCYSRESAIAEKFEAMVKLSALNSRMKDFYDIWLLSRQFDFEGATLAEAIRLTFKQRGTIMPETIDAFADTFVNAKQAQWQAFHRRLGQDHVPSSFSDVAGSLRAFLEPIAQHLSSDGDIPSRWVAPGPWG